MTDIKKQKFVCLDCETTGLDTAEDRIIEVAAILFDIEQTYDQFESLVNPGCPIPEASMAIHHITDKMVCDKPSIKDVLPVLFKFIGHSIILGHGINFDIDILAKCAEREGIATTIKQNLYIDTLRMARIYGESPKNSLEQLRKHFHVEQGEAHRAMSDVIVNIEVFKQLVKPFPTVEKLFDTLSRPVLLKEIPLGKYKGRPFKEVPSEYLQWAASKDFDQDLLYSIRTELKKRKKGNLFSQAGNPFMDL